MTKLSFAEIKKLKGKMLLDTFSKVRSVACNLHYCGTLSMEEAARQIKQHLPLEEVSIPSNSPYIRDLMTYDKPTVFFMDMEDVTQSIIYAYMYIDPLKAKEDVLFPGCLALISEGYVIFDVSGDP